MDPVSDLLRYIDASPTPYHAVAESARRLRDAGYALLEESEPWELSVGDRGYCVRGDGSLVAFEIGSEAPGDAGFRIVGAHTDSPNLRLKPVCDVSAHGYRQLAVETYGGLLLHTWLDRDLSLAGRVSLDDDAGRASRWSISRAPACACPVWPSIWPGRSRPKGSSSTPRGTSRRWPGSTIFRRSTSSWCGSCATRASPRRAPSGFWRST